LRTVVTIAGSSGASYIEGIGTAARFSSPSGVIVDVPSNTALIADHGNHRIRKVDLNHFKTGSFISMYQYATDTTASAITLGGTTNIKGVRFNFTFKDDDWADTVKLDVEIKPVGTAFDGTNLVYGKYETVNGTNYTKDIFVGDPILAHGTSYHWQYRLTDLAGNTTGWVSYGGNSESVADFVI
jgi:hypothetical protein